MIQIQVPGRFSYAYIFQKTKPNRDGKSNYQVDVLWPKTDQATTNLVWGAVQQVHAEAQQDPKLNEAMVRQVFKADIIKDGARAKFGKPDYERYKDCYYIVAKSREPIQVIDQQTGIQLLTDREFFSGCFGIAGVAIKTYQPTKNVPESGYGINCSLLALMKTGGTEADRWAGAVTVDANQFFGVQAQPGVAMPGFGQPVSPYGASGPVGAPTPPQFQQPVQQSYGQPQQFGAPAPAYGQPAAQPAPQSIPGNPAQYGQPNQPVPGQVSAYPQQAPQPGFGAPATGQPTAFPQTQPAAPTPGQGFGVPQAQSNPFPQTGLPQQPVGQPGFQTGQPAQFAPTQPQQPVAAQGQHQPTPAFGAPQGFDPYPRQ